MTRSSALVCLVLAACAGKADPHGDETARKIDALEQQVAAQHKEIAELRQAMIAAPELAAMLEQISALGDRLAKLESGGGGGRPSAPPHRYEPDPAAVYAVPVGGSPQTGSAKAKITMVMAGEFACPYCRKAWDTVDELRKKYGADLRVVYKSFVVHPQRATLAAEAACAAHHQGKWRAMADLLWAKAFDKQADDPRAFESGNIDAIASEAKLDMKKFHADLAGSCVAEVKAEQDEMAALGVGATPTFFINGRYIAGAQPIDAFATLIDEELAKANAAIKGGVKADKYYDQEILGKGQKTKDSGVKPNPF